MMMRWRAALRQRGARTPRRPEMAALLRALAAKRKMAAGTEDAPRRETTMHHKSPSSRGARPTLAGRRGQSARPAQTAGTSALHGIPRERRPFSAHGTPDQEARLQHARARARRAQVEQRRAVAAERAAMSGGAAAAHTPPDLSTRGLILQALDLYDALVAEAQASLAAAVRGDARADAGAAEHLRTLRARIGHAREDADAMARRIESFIPGAAHTQDADASGSAGTAHTQPAQGTETRGSDGNGGGDDTQQTQDDLLGGVVAPALAYCLESIDTESEMLIVTRLGMRALQLDDARIEGHRARLYPQYRPLARLAAALQDRMPATAA